ncbi:MAG: glycosyltransferase family 4 protein [Planctomycetes bacterium]|nr:glycosyltransferase family 4 protein [Planctomycetota bacterium]
MNQVRIHGDPFGEDAAASLLRSFLRFALGNGMACSLSLSAVRPRAASGAQREVPLTDGVRDLRVATSLPPAEVDLLLRAAGNVVAATAPVVVFADAGARSDAVRSAGLEWPQAAIVLPARDNVTAADLFERVRAELRWAGCEHPPHALEERELAPWLALPRAPAHGAIVHVGSGELACGTDLVVDAWLEHFARTGRRLRLVLTDADADVVAALQRRLQSAAAADWEILRAPFEPGHARDAAAIVLPWRREQPSRLLVQALACGRVLCVSRFADTVGVVGRDGVCVPIGGRFVPSHTALPFAPDPRAVAAAMRTAVGDSAASAAIGRRAQRHVLEQLTRARPAAPPPPIVHVAEPRPTVVLEAPFFEVSSSSELSIETARALLRRGAVELRLVPRVPFHGDLATFRRRAPELEPLLCRDPGAVDLWLASGWPVRATRPACRRLALRVDWEFGALPWDLAPHVTQDADFVVVHSQHTADVVAAAGRDAASIVLVPHGTDAPLHELAPPDPCIVQWKAQRPAVLFCGGMVWRKGFDVFLHAVLAAREAGQDFVVVVKSVGSEQHYGRFHLGELVRRFQQTRGTPPLLWIDDDLSREQLASLYTACDVLLHPYRGEGFGLPVLEARACGLPVVATGGGAADALLQGPGAVCIPSQRRHVDLPGAHIGAPWVVEPSAAEAGALLVDTLVHRAERRREAQASAAEVRRAFAWERAAEAVERLALAAQGRHTVAALVPGELPLVTLPASPRPQPVGAG